MQTLETLAYIILGLLVVVIVLVIKLFKKESTPPDPVPGEKEWKPSRIIFINNKIKIGGNIHMVTAKVDQKFGVTWPSPTDKYGNATEVENVTFEADDESIATIEADPETGPYSAIVHTQSVPGATAVRIKADPKVGEEVGSIEGSLAVEVTSGEATGFGDPTNDDPVDDDDAN